MPFQLAKFYGEINSKNTSPFDNIIIYQLKTKTYDYYNVKWNKPISFKSNNKKSSIYPSYEIGHFYKKLLGFRVKPLYDIDYITVHISVQGSSFFLSNGGSKNITDLNPEGLYTIFMSTSLYDVINFNLTTNYVEKPFQNLTIVESSATDAGYIKNSSISMNTSKENNQLISFNSYIASNYYSYYVRIKIIPNDNIKYIYAKINIVKTLFNAWEKKNKRSFNNLKSEYNYYASISLSQKQKSYKITFEMSYKDYMPFDYLYLCESKRHCEIFNNKLFYKDMEIKIEKDTVIVSFEYLPSSNEYSYLYLRFSPKYDIPSFTPYYELTNEIPDNKTKPDNETKPDDEIKPENKTKPNNETNPDDENKIDEKTNNSKNLYIIIISISLIVIIIIIFSIICIMRNKKDDAYMNYVENLMSKQLYPISSN